MRTLGLIAAVLTLASVTTAVAAREGKGKGKTAGLTVAPRARWFDRKVSREPLAWLDPSHTALLELRTTGRPLFAVGRPQQVSKTIRVGALAYDMSHDWFEAVSPEGERQYFLHDLEVELEDGTRHQIVRGSVGKVARQLARLGVETTQAAIARTAASPAAARPRAPRPPSLRSLLGELEATNIALDEASIEARARGHAGETPADRLNPEATLAGAEAMLEELGDAAPAAARAQFARLAPIVRAKTLALRALPGTPHREVQELGKTAEALEGRGWEIVRASDRRPVRGHDVVRAIQAGDRVLARRRVSEAAVVADEGGYEIDSPSGREMWTTRPYQRATTVSRVTTQHELDDLPALRAFLGAQER